MSNGPPRPPRAPNGAGRAGLVNGLSPASARLRSRRTDRRKWKWLVFPVLLPLLVLGILLPSFAPLPRDPIDSDFADWTPRYPDGLRAYDHRDSVRGHEFYYRASSTLFASETPEAVWVLIDTDARDDTGYAFLDIGADALLEVSGSSRYEPAASYYDFNPSREPDDWNGFEAASGARAAAAGAQVEMRAPGRFGDFRAYLAHLVVESGQARLDVSPGALGPESSLIADLSADSPTADPGSPFATLVLRSWGGEVELAALDFEVEGVAQIELLLEGSSLGRSPTSQYAFSRALRLPASSTTRVDVSIVPQPAAVPGTVVGLSLAGATGGTLSTPGSGTARAYLVSPSTSPRIDGLFAEWAAARDDPLGDVQDRKGAAVPDRDGDILAYASQTANGSGFFHLRTGPGPVVGALVPAASPRSSFTSGPVKPNQTSDIEPLPGRDLAYALVDADSDPSTGYVVGTIGAEVAVQVAAHASRISEIATLTYAGSGADWDWSVGPAQRISAALGPGGLELEAPFHGPTVFLLLRWNGNKDGSDPALGILSAPPDPYIVEGFVTDENGNTPGGIEVMVCNTRTGQCLNTTTTVPDGYYQVDIADLPAGYLTGDPLLVTVTNGSSGAQGSAAGSATDPGGTRIDVTIPEFALAAAPVVASLAVGLGRSTSRRRTAASARPPSPA